MILMLDFIKLQKTRRYSATRMQRGEPWMHITKGRAPGLSGLR